MKQLTLISLFTLLTISSPLLADTDSYIPFPDYPLPTFAFYNNQPIRFTSHTAYEQVIEKWQKRIRDGFNKFFTQFSQELETTEAEFMEQLDNPTLVEKHHAIKNTFFTLYFANESVKEEDIAPEVLAFIKGHINKFTSKRNYTVILVPNSEFLIMTFGSDLLGHTVLCNSRWYSPEHIKTYYQSLLTDNTSFFCEEMEGNEHRWISIGNLMHHGLTAIAIEIEQQSSLISFIVNQCTLSGKKPQDSTINLYNKLNNYETNILASLYSANPLEDALFMAQQSEQTKFDRELTAQLVKDIANSYDEESLDFFNSYMKHLQSLF